MNHILRFQMTSPSASASAAGALIRILAALISVTLLLSLTGCTENKRPKLSEKPNIELIQDMMDQPAIKAQDYDPYTGEAGSRLPPEGTVPIGFKPYKYKGDPVGGATQKNPLAGDFSPEILSIGQKKYQVYCLVCHGPKGAGDGPVAPKMLLKPPSVVSEKIVKSSDGAIYHIITDGQGVMGSYAYQIVNERDRWAVVNYIRSLQKLQGK